MVMMLGIVYRTVPPDQGAVVKGAVREVARGWPRKLLLALLFMVAAASAQGQELSDEAIEALREGQRTAALAMVRYSDHYPDQPLWREAVALGERARRLAPDRTEPYRFLGQVYSATGWYSRAWDSWRAYLERGGELDAQARNQLLAAATWLGFNAYSGRNYARAVPYLEEAVRLNPEDRLSLSRLADAHIQLGEPAAARPYAETLAQLDPDAQDLLRRVDAYLEHGVEAVEELRAGRERYASGAAGQALEHFERALLSSPRYAEALEWAGRTALELDRPERAVEYLQRYVELEPGDEGAREALTRAQNYSRYGTQAFAAYQEGLAAYSRGDITTAERRFQSALSRNPRFGHAHAWLGRILFERNEFEEALERFRQAVRLEPEETSYRFYLSATERQLALRQEELARAQEEAQARAEEERARAEAEQDARARAEREAQAREEAELAARERAEAQQAELEQARARQEAEARAAAEAQARAQAEEAEMARQAEEAARAQEQARTQAEAAQAAAPVTPAGEEAAEVAAGGLPAAGGEEPSAAARTLLVADVVLQHSSAEEGGAGAFSFVATPDLERDFSTFSGGTLFQRLEVRSKPSDVPVHYQLCLVPNDDISVQPLCASAEQLVFADEGVYESRQELASLSGAQSIDWSSGFESLILVIKDPSGLPVDNRYLLGDGRNPPDPELYYPMEVRYSAVVVPRGGSFPGWPQ